MRRGVLSIVSAFTCSMHTSTHTYTHGHVHVHMDKDSHRLKRGFAFGSVGCVCGRACGCCSVAGPVMTHAMCPTQHVCSGGVSFQADRAGGGRDGQGKNILLNFAGHSIGAECILARADYCILILPSPSRLLLKIPNTVRFTVKPPPFCGSSLGCLCLNTPSTLSLTLPHL